MPDFTSIGKLDDFPPGSVRSFQINGQPVCVARAQGHIYAVSGFCTHEYVDLAYGYVMGREIYCGQHEAGFDLATGEVVRGPAEFDLRTYEVKVEGDEVFVSTEPS